MVLTHSPTLHDKQVRGFDQTARTTLAGEVVVGYRSQSDAEFGFRQLKDPHVVSFSPMHHPTDHNIRGHVFTCLAGIQEPC